jgi:hypothetical protein
LISDFADHTVLPEIAILRHFRRVEPDGFDARTRPRVESPNAVGGTSELTEPLLKIKNMSHEN